MLRRLSEQRIHDLLDDLCTDASANSTLYRVKTGDQYSLVWSDVKEEESWIAPDKAEKEGVSDSTPIYNTLEPCAKVQSKSVAEAGLYMY